MYLGGLRNKGIQAIGISLLVNLLCLNEGLSYVKDNLLIPNKYKENKITEQYNWEGMFKSKRGDYSIPLDVAKTRVKNIPESELEKKLFQDIIEINSIKNKWTYIENEDYPNQKIKGLEKGGAGMEDFFKAYDTRLARITVSWRPIQFEIKKEFSAVKEFFETNTKLSDELEVKVDGHKGLGCRYIVEIGKEEKLYTSYILIHNGKRGYEIFLSTTGGFHNLEDLLDKVKRIKFKNHKAESKSF